MAETSSVAALHQHGFSNQYSFFLSYFVFYRCCPYFRKASTYRCRIASLHYSGRVRGILALRHQSRGCCLCSPYTCHLSLPLSHAGPSSLLRSCVFALHSFRPRARYIAAARRSILLRQQHYATKRCRLRETACSCLYVGVLFLP